ncbi:MAG: hypothetical protein PHY54_01970 [Methylococcales bacterium]|nr:hypothetical protein [Methylococcales bacterium]
MSRLLPVNLNGLMLNAIYFKVDEYPGKKALPAYRTSWTKERSSSFGCILLCGLEAPVYAFHGANYFFGKNSAPKQQGSGTF